MMLNVWWLTLVVSLLTACGRTPTTAIPTRALTAEEQAYFEQLDAPLAGIGEGLTEVVTLLEAPTGSASWLAELDARAAQVQEGYHTLEAMTPPASQAAFHAQLTQASELCNRSMIDVTLGVRTRSEAKLRSASQLLRECTAMLENLTPHLVD